MTTLTVILELATNVTQNSDNLNTTAPNKENQCKGRGVDCDDEDEDEDDDEHGI